MKSFLGLTNMSKSRKVTYILVITCCMLLITAFVVGISANRIGIFLCYISAAVLILAFVHPWRQVKKFMILLGASLIGFFLFVVLHNLFYGLGEMAKDIIILSHLLNFLHAVFFIIAVMVCPPGFLIGAVGSVVMYVKKRQISEETP